MKVQEFCYNFFGYGRQKKEKAPRPIFDAIRKPTAPPSRKIGEAKPDEKARPSRRKIKHKNKEDLDN
jgi:hypothetical protein